MLRKRSTTVYSKKTRLVLDTSVLIEYIIKRSPYRSKVEKIFTKAADGILELFVTPITLSETLYVASRIYEAASIPEPNKEALNYITWIKDRAVVADITEEIMVRAGELKKQLHIALPDCYVIATAEAINAKPLFKKIEKEMKTILNKLRRLGVLFLDEINYSNL